MINILNKHSIDKKKLIGIGIFVVLLIALPVILIQVKQQQNLKQRAEGMDNTALLELTPSNYVAKTGETFSVDLELINPIHKDITAVDITLIYNSDVIEISLFHFTPFFSEIINDRSVSGKLHLVGVNLANEKLSAPNTNTIDTFTIGTIFIKAKAQGDGKLRFSLFEITAVGEQHDLMYARVGRRMSDDDYVVDPILTSVLSPTLSPSISPSVTPQALNQCQKTDIISCGPPFRYGGNNPSWLPIENTVLYRLEWCYEDADFLEDDFKKGLCGFITDPKTDVSIFFPGGAHPKYKVRVRSEKSSSCPQQPGEWSNIVFCTTIFSNPSIPEPPEVQLTLDKQIVFEGDTIGISTKVDSNVDGIFLFYGTSDEIPTDETNNKFFKPCDPKKECLATFSFLVPKGEALKIISRAHTPQNSWIASELKSVTIRHFNATINPQEAGSGADFTITANTEDNSQIRANINGPGGYISNIALSQEYLGDGEVGNGNYSYILKSAGLNLNEGVYSINFLVDGVGYKGKSSFIINNLRDACIPYSLIPFGDYKRKIDVVVLPDNYSESELDEFQSEVLSRHINFLFSKEPYLSNKDKFNLWFVKKSLSIDCAYKKAGSCFVEVEKILSQTCTFADKAIVLDKNDFGGYGGGKITVVNAVSILGSEAATLHEFGHTMGMLADEYKAEPNRPSDTKAANCDVFACPKWCSGRSSYQEPQCHIITDEQRCKEMRYNGVSCIWDSDVKACDFPYFSNINFGQSCNQGNVCLYGCAQSGGYRSSNYSIMGDTNSSKVRSYNEVSKTQIQKMINSYVK